MAQIQLLYRPFPNGHWTRDVLYAVGQFKKCFIADQVVVGGGLMRRFHDS